MAFSFTTPESLGNDPIRTSTLGSPSRRNNEYAKPRWKENNSPNAKVHSAGLKTDQKTTNQITNLRGFL
jgi:hypothetical protein